MRGKEIFVTRGDPNFKIGNKLFDRIELTIRQFRTILISMGKREQPKKFGSQLSHSTLRLIQGGRTKPSMLSPDYIVGLTDGEGSFSVYLNPPNKKHGSINYRVQCRYYIKMREDELPLLEKVKDFWGCGKIYFQREYRKNQRDNYRFEIFNYSLLKNVVVPFFKKYRLQSKRIKDFGLFCQILDLAIKKRHQSKKGLQKIKKLKEQMHA